MKNSSIILFLGWIALAILDFVAVFCPVPLFWQFLFSGLNALIILGSIPVFIEEFKIRRARKKEPEKPEE